MEMSAADKKFSPDRYAPLYNKVLADILYITYNIFPELEEHKTSRTPLSKLRQVIEKEGKDASPLDDKLKVIVSDIITQRFQSNLIKYKMLQQQEILRSMATGGLSPEEAILILLDQTTGDELEEKVLSKGKVSPQAMDELYRFYSRIGDNIERLSQRRPVNPEREKADELPFFSE